MKNLMKDKHLLLKLVNKQFEIIGRPDLNILDIENGVKVKDERTKKEKVVDWYKVYFFDTEEQYEEWREYCIKELKKIPFNEGQSLEQDWNFLDLVYSMLVKQKKEPV